MASSVAAGTVTVWWRPGIPLEIARIKDEVFEGHLSGEEAERLLKKSSKKVKKGLGIRD